MRRFGKLLTTLGLVFIMGLGIGAVWLHRWARRGDAPLAVAGASGVYRVRNGFADFYAAQGEAAGTVVLFDAGIDPSGVVLDRLLGSFNATRADVRAVFITHGHFDHVAAATRVGGARVWASRQDAALMRGEGGRGQLVTTSITRLIGIPPLAPSEVIDSRRDVAVPGMSEAVLAIPAPGHTSGSMLYLFRGVLFAGDALNYEHGRLELSSERFAEDPSAARRSIAGLPAILQGLEVHTICTGHGGCTPPASSRALLDDLVRRIMSVPL